MYLGNGRCHRGGGVDRRNTCITATPRPRALPAGHRPKLVVFGESLGSFGGEPPFLRANNVIDRADGALFTGPTFNNTMWEDLTQHRADGSPQGLPIYSTATKRSVPVGRADDIARPRPPWDQPRIAYLQQASDPIAWWNVDLLFHKQDWLREARGHDVLPNVHWIPVATFLQVSAGMAVAVNVPYGHGHRCVADVADAWAAILEPRLDAGEHPKVVHHAAFRLTAPRW